MTAHRFRWWHGSFRSALRQAGQAVADCTKGLSEGNNAKAGQSAWRAAVQYQAATYAAAQAWDAVRQHRGLFVTRSRRDDTVLANDLHQTISADIRPLIAHFAYLAARYGSGGTREDLSDGGRRAAEEPAYRGSGW
jgi:hypothetical protein